MKEIREAYNDLFQKEYLKYVNLDAAGKLKYQQTAEMYREQCVETLTDLGNQHECADNVQIILQHFYDCWLGYAFIVSQTNEKFVWDDVKCVSSEVIYGFVLKPFVDTAVKMNAKETIDSLAAKLSVVKDRSELTKLLAGYTNYWNKTINEDL